MLGLKAKASLLFFVFMGIFTGIVVFGNTVASKKIDTAPEEQDSESNAQTRDSLQNAIGPTLPSGLFGASEPENIDIPTTTADASTNLTQNLASLIGKSIVDRNPEGPIEDNLNVMGADGMANEALTESMKRFNPVYFSPEILQSEITIDNSQSVATYRAAAAQITLNTQSFPPPPASESVASTMKALAKRYQVEVDALRALPVPIELAAEHIKAIRIALGKERVAEVVADYENDPIYAMLALKLWDTLK